MTTLRKANINDCEFISSLFDNDEYQLYFAENETTVSEWKERFSDFQNMENCIILNDGFPTGWFTYRTDCDICKINILVVKHSLIGTEIGYTALHTVVSSLPLNIKKVRLDVLQRNVHAIAFYKRYGFRIIGEELQPVGDENQMYYNMELQR